ncbi:3'(2'),5'-bisphosphate nucleotidase [Sorochytrium milnesiophthora]
MVHLPAISQYAAELAVAVPAVRAACWAALDVQSQLDINKLEKADKTPVTLADFTCQAIINSFLSARFPGDAIIGEEDAASLRQDRTLAAEVTQRANKALQGQPQLSEEQVLALIDLGKTQSSRGKRFWTLDPIDGTKGFLRRDQYAVCLALIDEGKVQLGVLGCPNLPHPSWHGSDKRGTLMVAVRGQGAYQAALAAEDDQVRFERLPGRQASSAASPLSDLVLLESFESGHTDRRWSEGLVKQLSIASAPLRLDSQCKYGLLARREGNVYLRVMRDPQFRECIWDHAAGSLIAEETGATVTDVHGRPLDFTLGRKLSDNVGILGTNSNDPQLHSRVLAALQSVQQSSQL